MRETRETESALGDPTARAAVLLPSGVCRHAPAWRDRQGVAPPHRLRQLCIVPATARGGAVHIREHAPWQVTRRGIEVGVAPRGARTIWAAQLTLRLQRQRDSQRGREAERQRERHTKLRVSRDRERDKERERDRESVIPDRRGWDRETQRRARPTT
jgi:hypothetical protein